MRKCRGYTGYYKGTYLRSSLEFAYAYYLDSKGVNWKYEQDTFYLEDGTSYKPDFYIYDYKGQLIKIVEIKGEGNRESGIRKVQQFKNKYNYDLELVFYKDLVKLYREEMPIRLNTAKRKWIDEYGAVLVNKLDGEYNPMFGRNHSEETKKIISEKAKERFKTGAYFETNTKKMIEYNRKTNFAHAKKPRAEREIRTCLYDRCGNKFEVTIHSKQMFCSHECSCRASSVKATEAALKKVKESHEKIRELVLQWAEDNKEAIRCMKLNSIKRPLSPLYELIKAELNISDIRTITKAVLGEDKGRKELAKYLKEYVR